MVEGERTGGIRAREAGEREAVQGCSEMKLVPVVRREASACGAQCRNRSVQRPEERALGDARSSNEVLLGPLNPSHVARRLALDGGPKRIKWVVWSVWAPFP